MGGREEREGEPDGAATDRVRVLAAKLRQPARRGMARPRLLQALDRVWSCGLGLVVAPAGSGKTTLLGHFAASHDGSVAWYQAEASESSPRDLLAHIQRSLGDAFAIGGPPWESVDRAIDDLDRRLDRPALLVIDDAHTLHGSAAEAALARFIAYLPASLSVVLGSRRPPDLDLSRRRLDDAVVEIGTNDLRFRTWETEQLFNHEYRARLKPEELAELTRRTEGWVAGLQFFHLATRAKPVAERVRVLTGLGTRSGMVHDYLARNVLAELPDELARFMVRTSPLGWMTGALCDAFLAGSGSDALLRAAEARHVFTEGLGGGAYRYHEVIRAHLEDALVELLGEDGARASTAAPRCCWRTPTGRSRRPKRGAGPGTGPPPPGCSATTTAPRTCSCRAPWRASRGPCSPPPVDWCGGGGCPRRSTPTRSRSGPSAGRRAPRCAVGNGRRSRRGG